jgi:membrane-associated protease RseP (regulator of RpoE activity)
VTARVTDMRGVDLNRWKFDWDLTFAALVVHSDGTILHRYGGRDGMGPDRWLSTVSYRRFLEAGLESFGRHEPAPAEVEPLYLEELERYADKDEGKCIHCHMIFPSLREEAQATERWDGRDLWVYPPPGRIGLDLDRDDQQLVTAVELGSPAAAAGLEVGDRITRMGSVPVATASDLMHALHGFPFEGGELKLTTTRAVRTLVLEPGWKRGTASSFAWRPSKWGLLPAPGFGGPQLEPAELRRLGLPPGAFAFRVGYLVTWGVNARLGRAAARAGVREGQVVLGTTIKRDFESVDHFHAWWRLTRRVGEEVELLLWKDGIQTKLVLPVIE